MSTALTTLDENKSNGKGNLSVPENYTPMVMKQEGFERYNNASMLRLTPEETKILTAPVEETDVNIRPDGLIYLPHVFVRERLNNAVGIGQWAIIENRTIKEKNTYIFDGSLYIRGFFVARDMGEMEYHEGNSMQSLASVYAGAKSDCLVRCCKDLGIGKECWQPVYSMRWVQKFGVKVFIKKKDNTTGVQWRHIESMPLWNESGTVPDSPNRPKYPVGKSMSDDDKQQPVGKRPPKEPVNTDEPKQEPKALKGSSTGTPSTAQTKLTDAELLKELKELTKLDGLRVLYQRIIATDKKQYEAHKDKFSERRKELEALASGDKTDEQKKMDVIEACISALTLGTYERDIHSVRKLISEHKNRIKQQAYSKKLTEKLASLGIKK